MWHDHESNVRACVWWPLMRPVLFFRLTSYKSQLRSSELYVFDGVSDIFTIHTHTHTHESASLTEIDHGKSSCSWSLGHDCSISSVQWISCCRAMLRCYHFRTVKVHLQSVEFTQFVLFCFRLLHFLWVWRKVINLCNTNLWVRRITVHSTFNNNSSSSSNMEKG